MRKKDPPTITVDVLVIGGGLAGCWAALAARHTAERVALVDKAMIGKSGASTFAAGVMLAPMAEDDLGAWRREIVVSGEYMNDQDWVTAMLEEQIDRLRQMEAWGFPFERDDEGKIARVVGRGHHLTRMLMFHGHKLMEEMRKQVIKEGIQLFERIMVTDLLLAEEGAKKRVVGARGFHTRDGQEIAFSAGAVVLATGQMGLREGGGCVDNLTGDGVAMAYRAGATLMDMEFGTMSNIVLWRKWYRAAGISMIQGHGAYIINAKGERFMERYDPVLKERTKTYTLGAAFTKEALEGRGPIYVDMRHLKLEDFDRFERVLPKTMQVFKAAGIDPRRELIECAPHVNTPTTPAGGAGIKVDLNCQTNIAGLFAAGAVTKIAPHGTYSVSGVNLAYCCVSGYRAGRAAATFAQENPCSGLAWLEAAEEGIARFTIGQGHIPEEMITEQIKLATVPAPYSFFKHQRRIQETLNRLTEISAELLPKMAVWHTHHLVKALELSNHLTCARLTYKAALLRQESRGSHFREEFPWRDDQNWLKWILVKRVGMEDKFWMEEIPFHIYPIKPDSVGLIPYPVQYFFDSQCRLASEE